MQDDATMIPVQTRLSPDEHERFEELARENERSIAAQLRLLVKRELIATAGQPRGAQRAK